MPRVAWRISAGVRAGWAPVPVGSLRIAIVPPVKRITIIVRRLPASRKRLSANEEELSAISPLRARRNSPHRLFGEIFEQRRVAGGYLQRSCHQRVDGKKIERR